MGNAPSSYSGPSLKAKLGAINYFNRDRTGTYIQACDIPELHLTKIQKKLLRKHFHQTILAAKPDLFLDAMVLSIENSVSMRRVVLPIGLADQRELRLCPRLIGISRAQERFYDSLIFVNNLDPWATGSAVYLMGVQHYTYFQKSFSPTFFDIWGTHMYGTLLRELFKSLKPVNIFLDSKESDRFEAVFQSITLKIVKIVLSPERVADVAPKLISTFIEVGLQVMQTSNPFVLLRQVLQILFSQSVPNLRKQFFISDSGNMTADRLEEVLRDFNISMERSWSSVGLTSSYSTLPDGYFCKISLQDKNMELYYEEGELGIGRESPYSSISYSDSRSCSSSPLSLNDDDLDADTLAEALGRF